jgi:hypothetical protein
VRVREWQSNPDMKSRKILLSALTVLLIGVAALLTYRHGHGRDSFTGRAAMLALMPEDATAVVLVDLAQFRTSSFLAQLFAWAPRPALEEDYAQFVKATGFNYEKDLDRFAVAFSQQSKEPLRFAIAEGRFDRKKIEQYAERSGLRISHNGFVVFSINWKNTARPSFFTFLRDDRIAWTDDPSYAALFQKQRSASSTAEWAEHFSRLAGTPIFAVLRQEGSSVASLAQQAPGGFRSPQLASLVGQLQWITIGGKPEGDLLRVVIDGECGSETTIHQLKDFLGGIILLAQAGLNTPDTRKKLDPQVRDAYLELLKSAEVESLDRGTSKSVRVIFDVTPKVLQTARTGNLTGDPAPTAP